MENFAHRLKAMASQGGFALITGDPGQGKSKTLQWIAQQLSRMPDVVGGVMQRPQSQLADFYREMGELFAVALTPLNRYGGFKSLRARWKAHCQSTLLRPVLLIDEAQEVSAACLTELRRLQSACFDSESLLFTILCGDGRLPERFRTPELLPLGSRIRTRLQLTALSPEQMEDYLNFALIQAGHPQLMSPELIRTLAAHALNNLRVLNHEEPAQLAEAQHDYVKLCLEHGCRVHTVLKYPTSTGSTMYYLCVEGANVDAFVKKLWAMSNLVVLVE